MSVQALNVAIGGDLSGFERVIARAGSLLDRFNSRASQAGNTFDSGFGASVTRTTQQVGQSIDGLNSRIALLTQKRSLVFDTATITRTNQEITDLQARVRQLQGLGSPVPDVPASSGAGLASYATGLLSIGAALSAAKAGIGIIADLNRLDLKLQAVSSSTADFAQSQNFLQSTSDRLGLSYQTLANSYVGLKASAEGTNLAGTKTDAIFEAIVRRGAKLGLSNEQVEGSLLAVGQMMSKGTVAAEELRGQLGERLPGAFNAMARALGVTTSELGKMLQAGDVLAEDALPKLAAELQKTSDGAERNATTIVGGTARMTNQFQLLIAEFGKTAGIDTFFAKLTGGLADALIGARQLLNDKSYAKLFGGAVNLVNPASLFLPTDPALGRASEKSGQIDTFKGYSSDLKKAKIANLEEEIRNKEASLNKRSERFGAGSNPFAAERADLKEKKELLTALLPLQREANALETAARRKERRNSERGPEALDPVKALERDEKRFDVLTKKRKAILAQGGKFEGKDAAELADITERFARSAKPKKVKADGTIADDRGPESTISTLNRLAQQYEATIQSLGGIRPEFLSPEENRKLADAFRLLEGIKGSVASLKELSEKTKLPDIANLDIRGGGKGGKRTTGDGAATILGVPSKTSGVNVKGVLAETEEYYKAVERSKREFAGNGDTLISYLARLVGGPAELKALNEQIKADGKSVGDSLDDAFSKKNLTNGKGDLALGIRDTLTSVGDAIGKGGNPLKAGLQTILDVLGDYLIKLGSALLLASTFTEAAAAVPTGLSAFLLAAGINQQVAGAGLLVGGAAIKALGATAFADGGLVYGPTLSYTGEYAGAKNNPEVIAPLSKLKTMLSDAGGGRTTIAVGGSLRGQDLRLQAVRAGNYSRTFGA